MPRDSTGTTGDRKQHIVAVYQCGWKSNGKNKVMSDAQYIVEEPTIAKRYWYKWGCLLPIDEDNLVNKRNKNFQWRLNDDDYLVDDGYAKNLSENKMQMNWVRWNESSESMTYQKMISSPNPCNPTTVHVYKQSEEEMIDNNNTISGRPILKMMDMSWKHLYNLFKKAIWDSTYWRQLE